MRVDPMAATSHVFVIAEAGSNWRVGSADRDREMSRALIRIAAEAGADAVKFQTFRARDVYVADAGPSEYLAELGIKRSINAIFEDLEMPYDMIGEMAAYSAEQGIEYMSTPFSVADAAAVDPHVRRHKVASYEINHVRLLEALAGTGKPLIVSTGAASDEDIVFAMATLQGAGAKDITLLQCTASYPAPIESLNLRVIPWLTERFGVPAGLSDHSRDPIVGPTAAVALGARVIEKHFTMDNRLPGPDHAFAIEPEELMAMVRSIRAAEQALGSPGKDIQPDEAELRRFAVRSIQAVTDIAEGQSLVEGENVDVLRPGRRSAGMHPKYLDSLIGRRAVRAIAAGDGVCEDDVQPPITRSKTMPR
jgi:N-acetylneuraminate synthase